MERRHKFWIGVSLAPIAWNADFVNLPGLEERRGRTDKDRTSINVKAMKTIKCSHQNLLRCALSFGPKPRFPEGPTSSTAHISESTLLFADRKKNRDTFREQNASHCSHNMSKDPEGGPSWKRKAPKSTNRNPCLLLCPATTFLDAHLVCGCRYSACR